MIVRDLGSSNGTYVNGVRLQDQQRPLLDGQIVEFGSVLALLKLETPPTGDTATDVTAMHSYVRHLHDPPEAPKNPAATAMTLDAGTPGAATDHTQMLSQPACAEATTSSPTPGKGCELGKFSSRTARVIILAVVAIGLTVLFWLMLSRNR